MYDSQYFFVANPINRYSISPRQNLKANSDGSIDIYVCRDTLREQTRKETGCRTCGHGRNPAPSSPVAPRPSSLRWAPSRRRVNDGPTTQISIGPVKRFPGV